MQQTVEKVFFALVRFEINGDELCEEVKNLIKPEMLPALFKLSKRHDLAHLVGDALDKNGLLPNETEVRKHFLQERNIAVYRYEQQRYELEQISAVFEDARIPFIPLKGSVIRQYYPEAWMRTSCDIDILVDINQLPLAQEALETALGYQKETIISPHDISLLAPSGVHLELHHNLAEDYYTEVIKNILCGVWGNVRKNALFKKSMTDEMFYFYHVAHMAKHFKIGGCGVRSFLDIYLLKKHQQYGTCVCEELLKKGGLFTFAKAIEQTADTWFFEEETSAISKEIQEYVLYAGMYGDRENRVAIQQVKKGGRFRYLWSRLFISYEELKNYYPKLEGHKLLLPFYQIKRWGRLLFGKNSKNTVRDLKSNVSLQKDKRTRIANLLNNLEL